MGDNTEFIKKQSALADTANAAWRHLVYWKLAFTKAALKSCVAIITSLTASLNGNDWSSFSGTQKFVAIGCALVAGVQIIDALLSSAMNEVAPEKKKEPVSDKPTDPQV